MSAPSTRILLVDDQDSGAHLLDDEIVELREIGQVGTALALAGRLGPVEVVGRAAAHRLARLGALAALDPGLGNRAWLPEAAFVLLFVADMDAIAPLYGEASPRLALLEAGAICQLLEAHASACGLGLCQVAGLDFAPIAEVAALGAHHLYLHALAGGVPAWQEELL